MEDWPATKVLSKSMGVGLMLADIVQALGLTTEEQTKPWS